MRSLRLLLLGFFWLLSVPNIWGQENPDSTAILELIESKNLTYEQGIPFFRQGNLQLAERLFLRALQRETDKLRLAATHAWLAATCRGELMNLSYRDDLSPREYWQEADKLGRKVVRHVSSALAYDTCNGMALSVLGNLYNPYGLDVYNDPELSWKYLTRAVACDSGQGNAWMDISTAALQHGQQEWERKAYRRLAESGFITKPYLDYSRWILQALPDSAIFLGYEDLDTYPPLALQESEGLRPDVAIISLPLLRTRWYAEVVRDRYGLPLPDSLLDAIDNTLPEEEQGLSTNADTIIAFWFGKVKEGGMSRQIVGDFVTGTTAWERLGLTCIEYGPYVALVDSGWVALHRDELMPDNLMARLSSHYYVHVPSMERFFDSLSQNDLVGPLISEYDYSMARSLGYGVFFSCGVALHSYVSGLIKSGTRKDWKKAVEIASFLEKRLIAMKEFVWDSEAHSAYDYYIQVFRRIRTELGKK